MTLAPVNFSNQINLIWLLNGPHPRGALTVRADRAVGARSEWSPGVLAGGFSGAAARDCYALTDRDLNAITQRDVRAGCGLLLVERVADRVSLSLGACCACLAFRSGFRAGTADTD